MIKPLLKILVEGYARPGTDDSYLASPTTTLLKFKGGNYLIDPGANANLLLEALDHEEMKPNDITAIFLTHYHPDHFLNLKLFPKQTVHDGTTFWNNDVEIEYGGEFWLHPEFAILPTPGHTAEHVSILVDTENLGRVCIAQDVFWWEDGKQDISSIDSMIEYPDPFASNMKALKKSRKKILDSGATWIIPGHGKIFKNPDSEK